MVRSLLCIPSSSCFGPHFRLLTMAFVRMHRDVMDNQTVVDMVSGEIMKWKRLREEKMIYDQGQPKDLGADIPTTSENSSLSSSGQHDRDQFLYSLCKSLCQRAKRRGSRDDVTVIIVVLDP